MQLTQHIVENMTVMICGTIVLIFLLSKLHAKLDSEGRGAQTSFPRFCCIGGGFSLLFATIVMGISMPSVDYNAERMKLVTEIETVKTWYNAEASESLWASDGQRADLHNELGQKIANLHERHVALIESIDPAELAQQQYVRMWVCAFMTFIGIGALATVFYGFVLVDM